MMLRLLGPFSKALAMKRFGYEVAHFALVWQTIGPIGYVDTSPLLLSTRWPRVAVIAASIFTDLLVSALLSCFAYYYSDSSFFLFAWLCALCLYLQTLRALDPMLDSDGYQLLNNILESPKLRELSINWLLTLPTKLGNKSQELKNTKLALIYWIYCLLYLLSTLFFVTWIQGQFLPYWPKALHIQLLVPIVITVVFFLEVVGEVQYQKKKSLLIEIM